MKNNCSTKIVKQCCRSFDMPLINCHIHLELNCTKNCVMSDNNDDTTFKIKMKNLYFRIITLSTEDNVKLTKQLNKRFKRFAYWNESETKMDSINLDNNKASRIYFDASFQGVKRLFVLVYDNNNNGDKKAERNNHRKYFLPIVNITNSNVLVDGRIFL